MPAIPSGGVRPQAVGAMRPPTAAAAVLGQTASARAPPRRSPFIAALPRHRPRATPSYSSSCCSSSPLPPRPGPSPWPLLDALDDARGRGGGGATAASTASASTLERKLHWTLSEPLTKECDASEATALAAGVSPEMARELVDLGAVYVGVWPEGRGPDTAGKWQRVLFDRRLQPGKAAAGGGVSSHQQIIQRCPLQFHSHN